MFRMILAALLITIWTSNSVCYSDMMLVKDGHPQVMIVVPKKSPDEVKNAAKDLRRYLELISDAQVRVVFGAIPKNGNVILVGESAKVEEMVGGLPLPDDLGRDGYAIKTFYGNYQAAVRAQPSLLVLVGDTSIGVNHAVYSFLEELGCRFFMPHADGEHIPRSKTITVSDLSIVSRPDFDERRVWDNSNLEDKWMSQATLKASRSWYVKNKLGGERIDMGHNYVDFCPKSLFEQHPEYFPLAKPGTEFFKKHAPQEAQEKGEPVRILGGARCLSNPELVQLAVEAARKRFDSGTKTYSLSADDISKYQWCQCDACVSMDEPDPIGVAARIVRFNNQVAEGVAETHGDRGLLPFYAEYGIPGGPPVKQDGTVVVKVNPLVVPVVVNVFCQIHTIDDPNCHVNGWFRWRLECWNRLATQIYIRDYYMWAYYPMPTTWTIGPKIRYYRDLGVKGYSGEVVNTSPDVELSKYISARMLWDSDQDPDVLVDEFFRLYFQEVENEMRLYYEYLNNMVVGQYRINANSASEVYYTTAVITDLERLLSIAENRAKQPLIKRRLRRERVSLTGFGYLRKGEDLNIQWQKDKNAETAKALVALDKEASAFLDSIRGKDIIIEDNIKKRLNRWAKKASGE